MASGGTGKVQQQRNGLCALAGKTRPNFNPTPGRQLGYSLDLFRSASLTGETQRIPRGTPVSILRRERNRIFIRADYDGTPYYGWVDTEDLRAI
jgi:hypothetical protein